mmetsp:Transcript_6296/g.14579  ORF Transcript_6296/g.14579 Transcript_6296/m.14579 type:complete len:299 (-) Transcript_6296:205-1101(-)
MPIAAAAAAAPMSQDAEEASPQDGGRGSRKTGPGVRWQKLQQACDKVVARAVRDWLSEDMAKGQIGQALPPNSEHIVRSAQAASAAYLAEFLEKKQAEVLKAHHASKLTRSLDEVHYGSRGSKPRPLAATIRSKQPKQDEQDQEEGQKQDQEEEEEQQEEEQEEPGGGRKKSVRRRSRSPLLLGSRREERQVEDELQERLTEHFRTAKYAMMKERLSDQERENCQQAEMNERMRAECSSLLDHLLQDTSALLAPLMVSKTTSTAAAAAAAASHPSHFGGVGHFDAVRGGAAGGAAGGA